MSDEMSFEISIPSDDDGFILLQCSYCGEFFKIPASECNNDENLFIHCPSCGLVSESYLTEDVIKLAQNIATNYAMDMIFDAFKDLERKSKKNSLVSFKAGKKPRHEDENPLRTGIEAMERADFLCCKKQAKIKTLLKLTGCYCPFCGVKQYEVD